MAIKFFEDREIGLKELDAAKEICGPKLKGLACLEDWGIVNPRFGRS